MKFTKLTKKLFDNLKVGDIICAEIHQNSPENFWKIQGVKKASNKDFTYIHIRKDNGQEYMGVTLIQVDNFYLKGFQFNKHPLTNIFK